MKRKILSLILVFAMTVSLLTVGTGAVEPTYGDTAGHWAESSIERWSAYGIIQGSNGQFDPNGQLTCAQLATILAKLLKLPAAKDAGFTDNTADAWYYDAINRCAAAGILNGNGDGTVTPEAPITRERAMVMLARALGIEPIRKPDLTKYTDAAQVSAYAQGYVAALIEAGIVGGVTADELAPQDNINRASTVTILDRAIGTYADKDGMTVNAKDGELVLVVAKNVKVINAPEGTKIVVADGATGLTVNGKSVSDDQTYIVPKTEPAKPSSGSSGGYSHSHSYDTSKWVFDDTKHWHASTCGHNLKIDEAEHTYNVNNVCTVCGQVKADVAVAKIGSKNFKTLSEAVAAATNGQTVTLVANTDISETGLNISKSITIDLNGYVINAATARIGNIRVSGVKLVLMDSTDTEKNGTGNGKLIAATDYVLGTSDLPVVYVEDGEFVMESGYVETVTSNPSEKGQFAIGIYNTNANASITINGGHIKAGWYCVSGNGGNATYEGEIIINGGILESVADYAVYLPHKGTTTVNGGVIYGEAGGVAVRCGMLKVNGGTITSKGTGSTGTWGDGTGGLETAAINVEAKYGISTVEITGGTFIAEQNALLIKNDSYESSIFITGGTFSSDPSEYVAEGYIAKTNNDGKYVVSMVGTAENPYTLTEFNALTKLPAGRPELYVNIGDVSLADGDVTIGNKDICDMWTWDRDTSHNVGDILEDGRKVYMVRENDTIYSSNKTGITLYISGSVNDNKEGGLNNKGDGNDPRCVTLSIPDASNVVFTEDFTVNGYFRMYTGWSDGRNLGGAVYNRTVKTVLFDHSTFNGIWIQNGGFFADSLTLDGCTFNAYENKVSANDSNPLWFCNIRTCDVTVKNCTFTASRPIKVVEQGVFGANVTITGNKFDMSMANSADEESKPKNDAIMFSTLIGETQWNPAGTLGNVVVSGNTVTDATAVLTFFNPSQITMAVGATFTVSNNILGDGVKTSVEWKTATEYKPDFVTVN